jgi:hypothetical protein
MKSNPLLHVLNHTYLRQPSKRSNWLVGKRWSCSATNERFQSERDASSLIPLGVRLPIIFELVRQRFSLLAAPPPTHTKRLPFCRAIVRWSSTTTRQRTHLPMHIIVVSRCYYCKCFKLLFLLGDRIPSTRYKLKASLYTLNSQLI